MYQTGDWVVYGIHGVCRIVKEETRTVERKQVSYLVLEPVDQMGTQFLVPSHNPVAVSKLRKLLSPEEMSRLLLSDTIRKGEWIPDENRRKQHYREVAGSGSLTDLLQSLYLLYRHREAQAARGRKMHQCDENFLRDTEKLLCSELCTVMGIPSAEAKTYLQTSLQEKTDS